MSRTTRQDPLHIGAEAVVERGRARERYARGVAQALGATSEHGEVLDDSLTDSLEDQLGASVYGGSDSAQEGQRDGASAARNATFDAQSAFHVSSEFNAIRDSFSASLYGTTERLSSAEQLAHEALRERTSRLSFGPDACDAEADARDSLDRAVNVARHRLYRIEESSFNALSDAEQRLSDDLYALQYDSEVASQERADAFDDSADAVSGFYTGYIDAQATSQRAETLKQRGLAQAEAIAARHVAQAADLLSTAQQSLDKALADGVSRVQAAAEAERGDEAGGSIADRIARLGQASERPTPSAEVHTGADFDQIERMRERFGG